MSLIKKLSCFIPRIAHLSSAVIPETLQVKAIAYVLNDILAEQLEEGGLDFLEDHYAEIKINDFNKSWYFTLVEERIIVTTSSSSIDVTISGDFNSFVLLSSQTVDPDTLFFSRKLLIEGNVEIGLAIKNLLDQVELSQIPTILKMPILNYAKLI